MRAAARRIRPDVVVVDPWVVLLHVGIGIADEAGRWHALLVGLPATATGLDLVSEVGRVDPTRRAVAGDAESAPCGQREVVRQAGMADRIRLCRQPVTPRQPVDVRRRGVPNDAGRLFVLHHDDEDVAERRERRYWSWGRCRRWGWGWGWGWRWGWGWGRTRRPCGRGCRRRRATGGCAGRRRWMRCRAGRRMRRGAAAWFGGG